ncbi:MAG: deoxyribodipyrimidine photo-lyase [Gammaproteobacteria bacterium]|nr:deoxyribodipyrimidine photo-lyase [Gammaproteobacteria bacterium]
MVTQVVWFKRDLRVQDHQALYHASCAGPVLCSYVLEQDYWKLPDTSNRQWLFVRDSLIELSLQLEKLGGNLLVFKGDACEIFAELYQQLGPFVLHSHQETGNLWTYERDKAVAHWCRQHQVSWLEYVQHAVLRGKAAFKPVNPVNKHLAPIAESARTANCEVGETVEISQAIAISDSASKQQLRQNLRQQLRPQSSKQVNRPRHARADWREHWYQFAKAPLTPKPVFNTWDIAPLIAGLSRQSVAVFTRTTLEDFLCSNIGRENLGPLALDALPLQVTQDLYDCPNRQAGGRHAAVTLFKSFLAERGGRYQATISSPLTAELGCSRLSPHLANGTVSIRELLHQLDLTLAERTDRQWRRSLSAFQSRLVWHCHFIQKLETNPNAELYNMHGLYNALDRPWQPERFAAWQHGRTGWPLVDACMRFLIAHGWLNFRMRAMLVSVACYTLKLPWQPVAQWLAQLFVDYEPGIHYPQIQMQSGTNGNQVLRIYNPLSQAQELDPEGVFVRRWVTELQHVPTTWIFTPEKMPIQLRQQYGAEQYPIPMVDFVIAHRAAKQEISTLRNKTKTKNSEAEAREQFSLFAEME